MPHVLEIDNPWHRLPWSLPLALAISAVMLWEMGRILERPPVHRTVPASIDAELIELPPPAEQKIVRPEPERAKPAPRRRAEVRPQAPVALPEAPAAPSAEDKSPAPPATAPAPAHLAAREAPVTRSAGSTTMGAQALVRPLPQIPEDLREEAFNAAAVARFHIAADGSATFELIKPTPNPRLNRLLLEKLKDWRFFPAMREGKPVVSEQDVRITFEVK